MSVSLKLRYKKNQICNYLINDLFTCAVEVLENTVSTIAKINNNCWKAEWQNKIINVLPWVVAQDIMNFFNDVWMSAR